MENWDEVKRAVAFLFYKHGPIDRIESHNEYWLELDASLREQFNVFGAKPEDLKKDENLSLKMKKTLQKKRCSCGTWSCYQDGSRCGSSCERN